MALRGRSALSAAAAECTHCEPSHWPPALGAHVPAVVIRGIEDASVACVARTLEASHSIVESACPDAVGTASRHALRA